MNGQVILRQSFAGIYCVILRKYRRYNMAMRGWEEWEYQCVRPQGHKLSPNYGIVNSHIKNSNSSKSKYFFLQMH